MYENIYVAISRFKINDYIRFLKLSPTFEIKKIENLRPNIYDAKWIIEI